MLALAICFLSYDVAAQKKKTPDRFAGLDTTINGMLRDWKAAGCAVAVIEKDKVVYLKGYGYKDFESKIPVTANTQFAIGSCTKAFTATILGMLQQDGKLSIDKPVQEYLPELKFHNQHLTNHVTARDMMSHRTGLPRHDYSWYGATTPRDSLIYRIRFLEPSAELRQTWQYNNFMYLAQGVLAEKLTGKSWEDLVREKIFAPLEMNNANFSVGDMEKTPDFTYGYREKNDSIVRMPFLNIDPIGPAGSINASAADMAKWTMAWVNGGKYNGKDVIPVSFLSQAISAQMVKGGGVPGPVNPDVHFSAYGLGWMLSSYKGHYRVEHGGNIDGFSASVSFFPSDSVGIVVLVNQNASALPSLIRNTVSDRMLNVRRTDWSALQKESIAKAKAATPASGNSDSLNRKENTKPSHPLDDYTGRFEHPGYGIITISKNGDSLKFDFNHSDGKLYLLHYHYDMFVVQNREEKPSLNGMKIKFITGVKGEIESLQAGIEPAVKDITFNRLSSTIAVSKNQLDQYVGEYVLGQMTAKIYIRGDSTLMLLVPGQPDYELIPTKTHEFELKGIKGFSVRFDVSGLKAEAIHFIQPNGIFKATRKQ